MNRELKRQEKRGQENWILESIQNHLKWMRKETEPLPTWLVIRTTNFEKALGKQTTLPCLIGDVGDESPNKVAKGMIDKLDPDVWVFFIETWGKFFDEHSQFNEFMKTRKRGDLSKLPDKLESLNIIGKNRDGSVEITQQYWIIRDKDGKIIDFKPTKMGQESYLKVSYLNENPKHPVNEKLVEVKT